MRKRLFRLTLVAVVIGLPFVIHGLYLWVTAWPPTITMATGPAGGRHRMIMEALAEEVRQELKLEVVLQESEGSLRNIRMLQAGDVDFALYQSGARRMMSSPTDLGQTSHVRFAANLYSEVAHWIVHREANIVDVVDLKGKRIAVGQRDSGDYAMSLVLAEHFGLAEGEYQQASLDYDQVLEQFRDQTLDAAFITVGVQADVFRDLCHQGDVEFRSLENIPALVRNHISLTPHTIPRGLYQTAEGIAPTNDLDTVALRSQLLVRHQLPDSLVEAVTAIALSEEFMKRMKLGELFSQGDSYASAKPEYSLHSGAAHYYDPQLKPILNSNFVEAMEGMRSFLVSLLIAGYLGWRWWVRRNARQVEHHLDRYIHRLLEIERRQLPLGESRETLKEDGRKLQVLLDQVTELRQECLQSFTAHELNEDRSVDCFLGMCHALSDKINAKLTRVTLEEGFQELRNLFHSAYEIAQKTDQENEPPVGD